MKAWFIPIASSTRGARGDRLIKPFSKGLELQGYPHVILSMARRPLLPAFTFLLLLATAVSVQIPVIPQPLNVTLGKTTLEVNSMFNFSAANSHSHTLTVSVLAAIYFDAINEFAHIIPCHSVPVFFFRWHLGGTWDWCSRIAAQETEMFIAWFGLDLCHRNLDIILIMAFPLT